MSMPFDDSYEDGHGHSDRSSMRFRSHWIVFIPTIMIVIFYGSVWWLLRTDENTDGLARLALIVVLLGGPLLAVHAFLRFTGNSISIEDEGVRIQRIQDTADGMIPYDDISSVSYRTGLIGARIDVGTILFRMKDNRQLSVSDISGGTIAIDRLRALIAQVE